MFGDFLNLDYWKTKNKMAKIRDLINRIGEISIDFDLRLDTMQRLIDNMGGHLNPERLPPDEPRPQEEPETPQLLPDLIVYNIAQEKQTNVWNFAITVKNIGTASSLPCILNINIPSSNSSNVNLSIPALDINETVVLNHQYSFNKNSLAPYEYKTLIATADSNNVNQELSKSNNTKSTQFLSLEPSAGVILHAHNPEGKEIASVLAFHDPGVLVAVPVYSNIGNFDNNYGIAYDEETHGVPVIVSAGLRTISVFFNGMRIDKEVNIVEGNTYELFFDFPRVETNIDVTSSGSDFQEDSWRNDIYHNNVINSTLNGINLINTFRSYNGEDGAGEGTFTYSLDNESFDYSLISNITGDATHSIELDSGSKEFPIDMLSNSEFNYWLGGSISTGDYPGVTVLDNPLSHSFSNGWIFKAPADKSYNTIRVSYLPDITSSSPSNPSSTKRGGGTMNMYIASVPYDIKGLAV